MSRKFAVLALATAGMWAAAPASAQSIGDTVNGTLAFGPDGASGGNHWNQSSIVVPGTFTYSDGYNVDTATFGLNSLTITDNVLINASGFKMTFVDATNAFTGLSLVSSTFSPGLTYDFTAGTLTINWTGTSLAAGPLTAVFSTDVGAVPEAATWAMMVVGVGAMGYALRRHRTAVRFA